MNSDFQVSPTWYALERVCERRTVRGLLLAAFSLEVIVGVG